MSKKEIISFPYNNQAAKIQIQTIEDQDYFSLTDMARSENPRTDLVIANWLRNRNTIEFLELWEQEYNPNFNPLEIEGFKNKAGSNAFSLSSKQWISATNAIGIRSKSGRYGGTYAHKDIAFEFGTWLSPKFKLYLIKEYQRLKQDEAVRNKIEWKVSRVLAKANYHIHTDAVRQYLVPGKITHTKKEGVFFSSEANLLNKAVFKLTAKEWRIQNPNLEGNIRDYATTEQLVVLANLESLNSKLLEWDCDFEQRLAILVSTAEQQLEILREKNTTKKLKK